ncbi:16S rRNA (guanine(527)-N(7))-methyltransferase RsmG [Oxalobacter vibrioformis]|uniref:Ribosomal RNA small subunit methyltransferase G n=2 Tax=Oxalobacter vibrioformis TaxID=933080 RepID=A0A9E9P3T3_9BURK|nr:16S rRNA (guanine(527)-N(7))-methyltransferase RsmG [Oxalobacter vibrioformis]WAW11307.1 16S rRNA (guanine(527)-N(7))-methyltransferase RsmG [Oxalobacter vibrioformis]
MAKALTAGTPFYRSDQLEEMLVEGSREIGIDLDESMITQLLAYLTLLSRWNTVYNLTAIRSPEAMITHHLLDSLAVVPALKEGRHILDVGAGAGLPGIVLAILYPETAISLIDAVQKKTAFLSQVKAELRLKNVTVHTGRVEKLRIPEKFDVIISRAFSDLSQFVELSGHLLADAGKFYAMKGTLPEKEMAALPAGLKVQAVVPLKVPFLDAERHLIVMEEEPA